jgi:hypothetical protein
MKKTPTLRKSPASSLIRMSSEDIERRQWTDEEKRAILQIAIDQEAGDDSKIDFSDIPQLTENQLANIIRRRELNEKQP